MAVKFVRKRTVDFIIDKVSRYLVYIPVTKTTNYEGEESLTSGTPEGIQGYYVRHNKKWLFDEGGRVEGGDAIIVVKADTITLNENDLVLGDGLDYDISSIDGDTTTISCTTSTVHGLSVGDKIAITGTTNYNGEYVVATVPTTTTLTITDSDHDLAAETSGKLTRRYNTFRIADELPYFSGTDNAEMLYRMGNLFLYTRNNDL